jgi:hypothetical protein
MNPPTDNGRINEAHQAYLRWLRQQNNEDYTHLRSYRDYYAGEHNVQLTRRLRAFLQVKPATKFNINFCKIPVNVMKERLAVEGFEAENQSEQLGEWWQAARMDGVQKAVHLATFRDGRTFVIVGWDNERGMPTFNHNLAYDGDYGVKVAYDEENPNVIAFAAKVWKVEDQGVDGYGKMKRANFYTPDAIYKFKQAMDGGDWQPYVVDGEEWPIDWTDNSGQPFGVPVVCFRNSPDGDHDGLSELHDLVGPQNMLNKGILDVLAAADVTGFQMFWKTAGSDPGNMVIAPGQIAYDENPETEWGTFPPADLTGLRTVINDAKSTFAQISRIPLSYFQITGAIASSETQKADDTGLVSKVEDRAVDIGNSWEDCMYMARRLHNVWGSGAMGEDVIIQTKWGSFERVDKRSTDRTEAETNDIKAQTFERLLLNQVPRLLAAQLAGYDQDTAEKLAEIERGNLDGAITQSGASAIVETAVGGLTDNLETDKGLNGAQINAALVVLEGVVDGTTTPSVAIELLVSVGIARERATRMVNDTKANAKPVDNESFGFGEVAQ